MTPHPLAALLRPLLVGRWATALLLLSILPLPTRAADAPPGVARLMEDDAGELLAKLTNPTGDPGEGHVEANEVFSGSRAIKIIPMQRFEPHVPGWDYHIVEKPAGPGEYRYVRFAWRTDGCAGTMVQLHTPAKGWNIRYYAGRNEGGWEAKQIAETSPARWTVVTRDLFADFGDSHITGIALTCFSGKAAWFDHVYFGRTIDDLERIDVPADGAPAPAVKGPVDEKQLKRLWADVCGDDARLAYRARLALAKADAAQVAPFLQRSIESLNGSAGDLAREIAGWIDDLGAGDAAARAAAAGQLARHLDAADGLLKLAAADDPSAEVRGRAGEVLRTAKQRGPWPDPGEEAVRILRQMEGDEARESLQALASGSAGPRAAELAKRALANER